MFNPLEPKSRTFSFFLFVLWPFAGFVYSLKDVSNKQLKLVVLAFFLLYGYRFNSKNEEMDSFRYAEDFKSASTQSFTNLFTKLSDVYRDEFNTDPMIHVINYSLSRVGDYSWILFTGFALIFGYFFLRFLSHVWKVVKSETEIDVTIFVLFFSLATVNFISNINGFRFYTASWVFLCGILEMVSSERKGTGLILCFSSILFHGSFYLPNFILWFYLVLGNRVWLYSLFCFLSLSFSSFFNERVTSFFVNFSFGTYDGLDNKNKAYSDTQYLEEIQQASQDLAWYVKYSVDFNNALMIGLAFFLILMYWLNKHEFKLITGHFSLLNFSILSFSVVNLISVVPIFGRFYILVLILLLVSLIFWYAKSKSRLIDVFIVAGSLPLLLNSALSVRMFLVTTDVYLFTPFLPISLAIKIIEPIWNN
jgi:hypothetical protein